MNGINGIRNGYNHLKAISTKNNDISFNSKSGMNGLPSITNLNNMVSDVSFNSYLNSDSIHSINNVVSNQEMLMNEYQNNSPVQYSLPAIRGFSQMNNQQYYNNNGFSQQACNPNDLQYQYPGFNYAPIVSNRTWVESYTNECAKPSVPSFPIAQNSYLSNQFPQLIATKDLKVDCKTKIKDEKYSVRRQKNNQAAKKCRDNKKLKSQELCDLVMKYEKENENLRLEINSIKSAIGELKSQIF